MAERIKIGERECIIHADADPEMLLLQAVDERGPGTDDTYDAGPCVQLRFAVKDWNRELSPWKAPAAFGKEDFGDGGAETLKFVTGELIPYIRTHYGLKEDLPVVIGGYSLAGLFSLWAVHQSDLFTGCAAASPSAWFPGWTEYVSEHKAQAGYIYLSMGDKEAKAHSGIRHTFDVLQASGVNCELEWNKGNHFADVRLRCAKAFEWCAERIRKACGNQDI